MLVVEDDTLTSQALCVALRELGATIIGPARDVAAALALIETSGAIDAALLDVNLGGERVYPVAEALVRREVPFIFATGCPIYDMPTVFWHMLRQDKPYDARVLAGRIGALCAMPAEAALPSIPITGSRMGSAAASVLASFPDMVRHDAGSRSSLQPC